MGLYIRHELSILIAVENVADVHNQPVFSTIPLLLYYAYGIDITSKN